jgi:hypothetical protein
MHYRGGTRQTTVVRTRARPLELRLAIAPYNKNRRILYYKVEIPLLKRHLIKYKAY